MVYAYRAFPVSIYLYVSVPLSARRDGKAQRLTGHAKLLRIFAMELLCFDRTCFVCMLFPENYRLCDVTSKPVG